jgi:hypothetical protein
VPTQGGSVDPASPDGRRYAVRYVVGKILRVLKR